MEAIQQKSNLISGILYAILAVCQLFTAIRYLSLRAFILLIAFAIIAVMMIQGKNNIIMVIGFGIKLLSSVFLLLSLHATFGSRIISLLYFAADLTMLLFVLPELAEKIPVNLKMFWLVPIALLGLAHILNYFIFPLFNWRFFFKTLLHNFFPSLLSILTIAATGIAAYWLLNWAETPEESTMQQGSDLLKNISSTVKDLNDNITTIK